MPHASRFVLHIMAAVAEHERQIIGERTRAALAAAKARGIKLGANGTLLAERHKAEATAYAYTVKSHMMSAIESGAKTKRQIADWLNATGIGASVVYVILGVLSVAPVIMLPMAFDAPGSEKNGGLLVLVASIAFFPISCLLGAILPWIFRHWRNASELFLMPVLNIGVTVLLLLVGLR